MVKVSQDNLKADPTWNNFCDAATVTVTSRVN